MNHKAGCTATSSKEVAVFTARRHPNLILSSPLLQLQIQPLQCHYFAKELLNRKPRLLHQLLMVIHNSSSSSTNRHQPNTVNNSMAIFNQPEAWTVTVVVISSTPRHIHRLHHLEIAVHPLVQIPVYGSSLATSIRITAVRLMFTSYREHWSTRIGRVSRKFLIG